MTIAEAFGQSTAMFISLAIIGFLFGQIKKYVTMGLTSIAGTTLTLFIINRLTFLGTIHHELAHALFAFLSGAKVIKIKLIEFKGGRLGSVEYIPRGNIITKSIQHTLAAYAPVICGFVTELMLWKYWNFSEIVWLNILKIYLMTSILLHMTMSKQDIKMCLKGLPVCIIIVALVLKIFNLDIFYLLGMQNLIIK